MKRNGMDIVRTGVILNTERYDECVEFYRDLFQLPVLHEKQQGDFRLTCLIETEGVASETEKAISQNPSKLRFNVGDVSAALQRIRRYGIEKDIERHAWGATINLCDPGGNRVGIRDEFGFETQE